MNLRSASCTGLTIAATAAAVAVLLAVVAYGEAHSAATNPPARAGFEGRNVKKMELVRLVAEDKMSLVGAAELFEAMDAGMPVISQQLMKQFPSPSAFESRCRMIAAAAKDYAAQASPADAEQVAKRLDEEMQDQGFDIGG